MSKMNSDDYELDTKFAGTMVSVQDLPAKDVEGWTIATSTRTTRKTATGPSVAPKVTKKSTTKRSVPSNDKSKSVKKPAALKRTSRFASTSVNSAPDANPSVPSDRDESPSHDGNRDESPSHDGKQPSDHEGNQPSDHSNADAVSGTPVDKIPEAPTTPNFVFSPRRNFIGNPLSSTAPRPAPKRKAAGKSSSSAITLLKAQMSQMQLALSEQTALMTKMMAATTAPTTASATSAPMQSSDRAIFHGR